MKAEEQDVRILCVVPQNYVVIALQVVAGAATLAAVGAALWLRNEVAARTDAGKLLATRWQTEADRLSSESRKATAEMDRLKARTDRLAEERAAMLLEIADLTDEVSALRAEVERLRSCYFRRA